MHLSNNPPPDAAHLGRTLVVQDACARIRNSINHLERVQSAIGPRMPLPAAEKLMEDAEHYCGILQVAFARTLHVLDQELDRLDAIDRGRGR